jgi:hypothetical protein
MRMNIDTIFKSDAHRSDVADRLRDQAASCRRLASVARTPGGARGLAVAADQFDDDARRMDPSSEFAGFRPLTPAIAAAASGMAR